MKTPKLNIKLLNRIKKHLQKEPKRYEQACWGRKTQEGEDAPACKTQGCIAGWAVFLSTPKRNWLRWINRNAKAYAEGDILPIRARAQKLLGLTDGEAGVLFANYNQSEHAGEEGVKEACRKIDDLITDRKYFIVNRTW